MCFCCALCTDLVDLAVEVVSIVDLARLRQGAHFIAKIAGNGPHINGSLQLCLI